MMNAEQQFKELKRGVVECFTDAELLERLKRGEPLRVKAGFDPTSPDLHLGHTVLIQKLRQFQDFGHQVVFLVGDFTAKIGDPSGRSSARPILTDAEIVTNMKTYEAQVFKILDRAKTEVRYNSEWLGKMSPMEYLQLGGKFTVARMMERNDFAKRHEAGDDVSIMEFYYPLMQAYDSVVLKADAELGGNDQKFNLLLGRTIQKRMGQREQVVITMPLLEGTDGVQKMSKSYGNTIGITEPPQEMFGKLMSITDDLMWRYYELLSTKTLDEIKALKAGHPKAVKVALAKEIVTRFHSAAAADEAEQDFERRYVKKEPSQEPIESCDNGLVEILTKCGDFKSKTRIRQLIAQGAVKVDGEKITDPMYKLNSPGEYTIQAGKHWHNKVVLKG